MLIDIPIPVHVPVYVYTRASWEVGVGGTEYHNRLILNNVYMKPVSVN